MATGTTEVFLKRNRFVAFAFAAADAFLEIDVDETIKFADGATQWLTGERASDLTGRPFFDFIDEKDRSLVRAALSTQIDKGRMGPIAAGFVHRDGRMVRTDLSGMRLPGGDERVFLSLGAPRISTVSNISDDIERDDITGLLTKESFTDVATRALHSESTSGEPSHMTLLDLGGLDALKERIGGEAAAALLDDISAHLRANSLSGNAAGQIDDEQFGMVHTPQLDVAALTDAIEASARHVDATGEGVVATAATIELDPGALSDADNGRALIYAMNKFSESHADFTITELSGGYQEMLDQTLRDIATFKRIIEDNEFDALYQPIVDLEEREIHHYEALARIRDMEAESSPYRFITFAEAFTEPNGKAYLKSMATLCHELGIETVGEMVETEQEAELLKNVGVTYGQGYLFGKPSMGLLSVGKVWPKSGAAAAS